MRSRRYRQCRLAVGCAKCFLVLLSATLASTLQLLRSNSRTAPSPVCPEPSYPLLASSSQERSEYEFEEVSPACLGCKVPTEPFAALAWHLVRSHGKSAPSLAFCVVGMNARFIRWVLPRRLTVLGWLCAD